MFESARDSQAVSAAEQAKATGTGPLGVTVHASRTLGSRLVHLQGHLGNAAMGRLMGVAPLRVQRSITVQDLTGDYEAAARAIEALIKASPLHQLTETYPDRFRIVVRGVPDDQARDDFADTSIRNLQTGEVLYGTGVDNMSKVNPRLVAEQGLQLVITMNTLHPHTAGAALQVLAHEFGVHVAPFTPHLQHLLQGGTTDAMIPELQPWQTLSGGRQHADFALSRSTGYNALRGQIVSALGPGGTHESAQALKAFHDQEAKDQRSQLDKTLLTVTMTAFAAAMGDVGISREDLAGLLVDIQAANQQTVQAPPQPNPPPAFMEPAVHPGPITKIPPEWRWGP